ncbi:predicted protein [Streptomyces viridochromogenes DSM 40736]|uniref:Predicted protein n=1 Tax=Streptomyces viridochromogenes (strain DSM 40736 / JCM 4977 / BCRC 1201 / Tue 494) TaxID=591159 RepID=D9XAG4_STRVT|nr:predicted protein [Streptomyces viridochromogenes DSM 40736]
MKEQRADRVNHPAASGLQRLRRHPGGLPRPAPEGRELLSTVPVAWDETRFLAADFGSHVVVARRKGGTWYIAGVNGRTLTCPPASTPRPPTTPRPPARPGA